MAVGAFFLALLCFTNLDKPQFGLIQPAWRLLLPIGLLRVLIRKEPLTGGMVKMDKLIIVYSIIAVVTGTILEGTFGGFVNRAGKVFDLIGMYFFFRFMIAEENDLRYVLTFIAVLLIPLGVLLFIEKTQGTNFFSILLKAPLELVIRDGKIRAMGPFQHPILAGTFCATCFPLIATLWWKGKKSKILFVLSTLAILVGIYASNSSGRLCHLFSVLLGSPFSNSGIT